MFLALSSLTHSQAPDAEWTQMLWITHLILQTAWQMPHLLPAYSRPAGSTRPPPTELAAFSFTTGPTLLLAWGGLESPQLSFQWLPSSCFRHPLTSCSGAIQSPWDTPP